MDIVDWACVIKALVVRCLLILHVFLCTWRVTINLNNPMYWLLLCILVPLLCESCYTIIKRHGKDFSRFTLCFIFYLGAVVPGIWLLELDRTDKYNQGMDIRSAKPGEPTIPGLGQGIWLIVIEEVMPYVIFISRWILPRGRITGEELSDLLFAFIEIGADIMEFFSLLDEDVVRMDKILSYIVLTLWTVAVLQFTMTIVIIHQPTSEKTVRVIKVKNKELEKEWEDSQNEIFAIFMALFMQDLPFFVMRLYIIVKFNRITYSIIFFISKNILVIFLLLYKVGILCKKRHYPETEEDTVKVVAIQGETGIGEVERGHARRNGSLAGSLANISIKGENAETSHENPQSALNKYSLDNDSKLKKRNGRQDHSNDTPNVSGKPSQRSNGIINSPSVHPQPNPHRPAGADHRVRPTPAESTIILQEHTISIASQPVYRNDFQRNREIDFDHHTKPVVYQANKRNRNHNTNNNKPSRHSKHQHQENTDEVSLDSFNSQVSEASPTSSSNSQYDKEKFNPENLQHRTPKHIPKHTSPKKTTHSTKEVQTQTYHSSPEQTRRSYTKPSISSNHREDIHRKHPSVPTQNNHNSRTAWEDKVPGPHVTKIYI